MLCLFNINTNWAKVLLVASFICVFDTHAILALESTSTLNPAWAATDRRNYVQLFNNTVVLWPFEIQACNRLVLSTVDC